MVKVLGQIIKSPNDERQYRALRLDNELECLLIHDRDALKSSAALTVSVGSYKDPLEAQGLAHYLEHMLFMGTKKYPEENQYSNYMTKNAGYNNAYTSLDLTNYLFQVSSDAFEGGLDRFAQFFISPLLSESSAEKEINAVDSEHQKNILNDSWRKYQLSKHISKQGHPYNKFSTGDKTTLSCANLQTMLSDFYHNNYSANLMKLVIYGQQDLDTLQKWAVQKFSQIPNHNFEKFKLQSQPFDEKAFSKLLKIVPVKDTRRIQLKWILPNKNQHYRNHPGKYVSFLVGHEGKGSILSWLMKKGLATNLSSGQYDVSQCYNQFQVSLSLTEKGLQKVQETIGYILYYIQMLKQKGCSEEIFNEIKQLYKLKFQFMDKKKGANQTSNIAKNLQDRKIQEILVESYLMEEWKPELIQEYLNELTLDNLIVFCEAKAYETDCNLVEPIYGTKYAIESLKELKPLECDVSLPEPNIFLPKQLECLPLAPESLPKSIYTSEFMEGYWKQDHCFKLPKANMYMSFIFDGQNTPLREFGNRIFLQMLKEHLREFVYLAQMADITIIIQFTSYYELEIKLKGFRDSLKLFVIEYLKRIFEFVPFDQQLFDSLVEKTKRTYKNSALENPYLLSYQRQARAMRINSTHDEYEVLEQIQNFNIQNVIQLNNDWKKKLFLKSYFTGNITEEESKQIYQNLENFLKAHSRPLKKHQRGESRSVILEGNTNSIIELTLQNEKEENSAVTVTFQTGKSTIRSEIILALMRLLLKEPAFDYLRTKQQLGYVVFAMERDNRGVGQFSFIVQSAVKSSHQVIKYIDIFVNEKAKKIIEQLSEEQFNIIKNAYKNTKEEKDKDLSAETARYWDQITKNKYLFDRKQQQLDLLSEITREQLQAFMKETFYGSPRRLELHMMSKGRQEENSKISAQRVSNEKPKVFKNISDFKRTVALYPDFFAA